MRIPWILVSAEMLSQSKKWKHIFPILFFRKHIVFKIKFYFMHVPELLKKLTGTLQVILLVLTVAFKWALNFLKLMRTLNNKNWKQTFDNWSY